MDLDARKSISALQERLLIQERRTASLEQQNLQFKEQISLLTHFISGREPPATPPPPIFRPVPHSNILQTFVSIFDEFQNKQWVLLYRGSENGFRAVDFHHRCDGHPNTLTIIMDPKGSVFGGFTPIAWESRRWNKIKGEANNCRSCDESGKSFIFTIRNPHGIEPTRFPLKRSFTSRAIFCDQSYGPAFGAGDLHISDMSDKPQSCHTRKLGNCYANQTSSPGSVLLTGKEEFCVREIEVFEIKD